MACPLDLHVHPEAPTSPHPTPPPRHAFRGCTCFFRDPLQPAWSPAVHSPLSILGTSAKLKSDHLPLLSPISQGVPMISEIRAKLRAFPIIPPSTLSLGHSAPAPPACTLICELTSGFLHLLSPLPRSQCPRLFYLALCSLTRLPNFPN